MGAGGQQARRPTGIMPGIRRSIASQPGGDPEQSHGKRRRRAHQTVSATAAACSRHACRSAQHEVGGCSADGGSRPRAGRRLCTQTNLSWRTIRRTSPAFRLRARSNLVAISRQVVMPLEGYRSTYGDYIASCTIPILRFKAAGTGYRFSAKQPSASNLGFQGTVCTRTIVCSRTAGPH